MKTGDTFLTALRTKIANMTPEEALAHHCEAHEVTVADILKNIQDTHKQKQSKLTEIGVLVDLAIEDEINFPTDEVLWTLIRGIQDVLEDT